MPTDLAILFPGQGSLDADAREQVERCAPALLDRCVTLVGDDPFERAPESTRFAQPAIFCASMAAWSALDVDPDEVVAFAGHSLGEISALCAAGHLDLDTALGLVVQRGRLMAEHGGGGMLALRASLDEAVEVAAQAGVTVANDNCPGQVVLSGDDVALQAAAREAKQRGLRAMRLDVAGAFHSPAMAPAVAPLRAALRDVDVREATAPVLRCATADAFTDIEMQLPEAITAPVRWREVLLALRIRGAKRFLEVGPGNVLTGLVRRTLPEAERVEVARAVA